MDGFKIIQDLNESLDNESMQQANARRQNAINHRAELRRLMQQSLEADDSLDNNPWGEANLSNRARDPALSRDKLMKTAQGRFLLGQNFIDNATWAQRAYLAGDAFRRSNYRGSILAESETLCSMNGVQSSKSICGSDCGCVRTCLLENGEMAHNEAVGLHCLTDKGRICFEGTPVGSCKNIPAKVSTSAHNQMPILGSITKLSFPMPMAGRYDSVDKYASDYAIQIDGIREMPHAPVYS